ncbi:hypothetical protein DRW07_13775 [Alteromonas sediminis]|uniref:Lipoprotein n=1 Tax=Alteromonas sediminis TaxID=2259342 RepID=A0A3N5YAN1_9ALTE|nr:hypothetical protein [Alteromonas sediminis]RPJ65875.1 hypothetical protein DRW07_13775 [Alteromonas sediminis]
MKKSVVSASLLAIGLTAATQACEWHDGPSFGVFGGMPKPMMQHKNASTEKPLEINHQARMTVESGRENAVDIAYVLPLQYRDIAIEFVPSEAIALSNDALLKPSLLRGTHQLLFTADRAGQHEIVVKVEAIKGGQPYSNQQRIIVTAL